mmetsp:Transcript_19883/g.76194  ORF Transcript_19883/g.76194 Transcript_19883/m.76194 type:complete len:260 (+) Transcript_19883:236-1015(+)
MDQRIRAWADCLGCQGCRGDHFCREGEEDSGLHLLHAQAHAPSLRAPAASACHRAPAAIVRPSFRPPDACCRLQHSMQPVRQATRGQSREYYCMYSATFAAALFHLLLLARLARDSLVTYAGHLVVGEVADAVILSERGHRLDVGECILVEAKHLAELLGAGECSARALGEVVGTLWLRSSREGRRLIQGYFHGTERVVQQVLFLLLLELLSSRQHLRPQDGILQLLACQAEALLQHKAYWIYAQALERLGERPVGLDE